MLKLYNTLTRKKQVFKPVKPGQVGIYSCGPTVYNQVHIGNLRAFLFADLLRRYLKFSGYKLKHIMNITDVDDKTILGSQQEKISLEKFTKKYTELFFETLMDLNIEAVEEYPKATEHIKEMVTLVKKLLQQGYAYKAQDGIYFDISKFKDYGKLSHLNIKNLKAGASGRIKEDEYDKKNVQDFVLWKFWTEDDGEVFWETGIGKGRPGWHLECSAMSSKYLGQPFDIHTGGVDLVFPHHENEIAQSEAATGKKFVNFWMHNEHLMVDGKKMSKSLGNFYTLKDLEEKGFSPRTVRYALLSIHYRQKVNLTDALLEQAHESVKKINDFVIEAEAGEDSNSGDMAELIKRSRKEFKKAMNDDLNIGQGLNVLFNFMKTANKFGPGEKAVEFVREIDSILDILKDQSIPTEIQRLAQKRDEARKNKDFKESDKIREELLNKGYEIRDKQEGYIIVATTPMA